MSSVAVTGGCGFIGSALVERLLETDAEVSVVCVDALTYAGRRDNLAHLDPTRVRLEVLDIRYDHHAIAAALEGVEVLYHLAAETHVTRSERHPERFYGTNVAGTIGLLGAALRAGVPRVIHVSTDEVYGPTRPGVHFREDAKQPGVGLATSAYAKSKALGDDVALDMSGELGIPLCVARPTNAYGPRQFPEKLLPRSVTRMLRGERAHVWGDGTQVRDWLHVTDLADALILLGERGEPSTAYNIGPNNEPEVPNVEVVRLIAQSLGLAEEDALEFVPDPRPRHDARYGVDASRVRQLGWAHCVPPGVGIPATARWYRDHRTWWEGLVDEAEALYSSDTGGGVPAGPP